MVSENLQERVKALESRVKELEAEVRQRSLDAAYVYIHSNWTLIRWYLAREQDHHGEGSETYTRSENAETIIRVSRAARRCTTAAEELCTTGTMRKD